MAFGRAREGRTAAAAVLVAGILLLAVAVGSADAASRKKDKATPKGSRWRQPPAPAPAPGAHLFRRREDGQDPLLWENDELSRIRDLHARSFDDKGEYLAAKNLAAYLGLAPVEQVHVPLPLHIVFLGFQGDGNQRIKIDELTLTEWFAHIDHLMPHTRVALADLTCLDDGHCTGQVLGSMKPSPLPSHVRLNFSCNVVVVQQGEVLETYERAISAFSRPVDPEFESGTQQVDALKLEAFIDSFVEGLGLEQGYTLIVANPKWSASLQSYGFRAGYSLDEITLLQTQVPEMKGLSLSHWDGEPTPPRGHALGSHGFFLGAWNHRSQKFSVSHLQSESLAWARNARAYLAQVEDHKRKLLKAIGPRTKGSLSVARAVSMLRDRSKSEASQLLGATIMMPPDHFHNPKWRASHPLEDCLTGTWVGHGRWLLLDLTAQKGDWGPVMGGEGVVTITTIPDVAMMFSEVSDAREAAREERAATDEREQALRDKLNQELHEKVRKHIPDVTVPTPQVQGSVQGVDVGQDAQIEHHTVRAQLAMLQVELDMYEAFALQHCHGIQNPPVACLDARDAATELRHELQSMASKTTSELRAFRDHNWDIFGLDTTDDTHPEVADVMSRVREHFLGQLSDLLSHGVRHVIAPPSATWHHEGYMHDTASPYAHKVHFTLYVIQDSSRKTGPSRTRGVAFDVEAYKAQVTRLALPHQAFTFSVNELALLDDPALATAFAVSTRTGFAEVPDAVSRPQETELVYLDSQELAAHLRRRFEHAPARRAAHADPHAALEVPVFIFNLDRDAPVLVDEHYNARALEDMVLVVDNAANQDEHPTGFMCDGTLLSRPLSPMRHALAATLQHLGGILPPHMGYHPGRKLVTHDWLWSVGAHPLSWTSTGTAYSQLQIDALHRSYIFDAIDRSAEYVNAGIGLLTREKPTEEGHKRVVAAATPLRQVLQTYAQVVNIWRTAVSHASGMELGPAAELIASMEAMGQAFYQLCLEVEMHLHPKRCAAQASIAPTILRWLIFGSAGAVIVTALLTCGLPRRKVKKGD